MTSGPPAYGIGLPNEPRGLTTREPRIQYALSEPDHSTGSDHLSGSDEAERHCQERTGEKERTVGNEDPAKNLDPNHAGPMREKTKASWEHS